MEPTNPTIAEISKAYIEYCRTEDSECEWAFLAATDFWLEEQWNNLWELVKSVAEHPTEIDDATLAVIAAGSVEDLLSKCGRQFIDKIEALAHTNERMAKMLTGVWRNSIDPQVWNRVVRFCRTVPNPIDGTYRY